ncbi:MAG: metal-sensitive transcriptional regulator [Betaproteobacteria bacterium]
MAVQADDGAATKSGRIAGRYHQGYYRRLWSEDARMDNPTLHDAASKKSMDARLARAEGQVRGIRRMIAEGHPCEEIALQLAAARKALDRAFYEMVSCMIRTGVPARAPDRKAHASKVAELLARFG